LKDDAPVLANMQMRILTLVVRGDTDKEIGRRLGLSVATVRWHLRQLYRRHNLKNRVEAAVAFSEGRFGAARETSRG
jgi:two-component system nitrate/nitrite response regulator NarL